MPISGIKLSAPTYNSTTNVPPFSDFSTQFESFVDYQEGGNVLIKLIDHALGRTRHMIDTAALGAEVSFSELEREALGFEDSLSEPPDEGGDEAGSERDQASEAESGRTITSYRDLEPAELELDRNLHNILDNSISGTKRSVIMGIKTRSWVQAWILLHKDMGATNPKRKFELMNSLFNMHYQGDSAVFQRNTVQLIQTIYDAHIKLEDVMMFSISNSLPEDLLALKLMLSQKMEASDGTPSSVYEFVKFTANTIEMTGPERPHGKKALAATKVRRTKDGKTNATCTRCGRNGHEHTDCFATTHADGTRLEDEPPCSKPTPKVKAAKATAKRVKPPTEDEIASRDAELQREAIDTAKKLLAKANAM